MYVCIYVRTMRKDKITMFKILNYIRIHMHAYVYHTELASIERRTIVGTHSPIIYYVASMRIACCIFDPTRFRVRPQFTNRVGVAAIMFN